MLECPGRVLECPGRALGRIGPLGGPFERSRIWADPPRAAEPRLAVDGVEWKPETMPGWTCSACAHEVDGPPEDGVCPKCLHMDAGRGTHDPSKPPAQVQLLRGAAKGVDPYRPGVEDGQLIEFVVHARRRQISPGQLTLLVVFLLGSLRTVLSAGESADTIWWLIAVLVGGLVLLAWVLTPGRGFMKITAGPSGLQTHTNSMPDEKRLRLERSEIVGVIPELEAPGAAVDRRRYRVTVLLEDDERTLIRDLEEPGQARWIANSVASALGVPTAAPVSAGEEPAPSEV